MPPQVDQFSTPGSAVAAAIQEILTRRRSEERQQLLDRIAGEDTRSVLAERESVAQERQEQSRRANEQLEIQRQAELRAKAQQDQLLAESRLRMFETQAAPFRGMAYEQLPANLQKQADELGMIQEIPQMGPPEGDQPLPPIRMLPGTREQQDEEQKRTRIQELIGTLTGQTGPDERRSAGMMLAGEGINIPSLFEGPTQVLSATGRQVRTVPAGENVQILPQPYVQSGGSVSGPDAATWSIRPVDGSRPAQTKTMTDAEALQMQRTNPGLEIVKLSTQPAVPRPTPAGVVKETTDAIYDLSNQVTLAETPGMMWGTKINRQQLETSLATADQAMSPFLADAEPKLIEAAGQILNDPDTSQKTVQQLVAAGDLPLAANDPVDGYTPQELIELQQLLTTAYLRPYLTYRERALRHLETK